MCYKLNNTKMIMKTEVVSLSYSLTWKFCERFRVGLCVKG